MASRWCRATREAFQRLAEIADVPAGCMTGTSWSAAMTSVLRLRPISRPGGLEGATGGSVQLLCRARASRPCPCRWARRDRRCWPGRCSGQPVRHLRARGLPVLCISDSTTRLRQASTRPLNTCWASLQRPEVIAHDAHPDYYSTRLAQPGGRPGLPPCPCSITTPMSLPVPSTSFRAGCWAWRWTGRSGQPGRHAVGANCSGWRGGLPAPGHLSPLPMPARWGPCRPRALAHGGRCAPRPRGVTRRSSQPLAPGTTCGADPRHAHARQPLPADHRSPGAGSTPRRPRVCEHRPTRAGADAAGVPGQAFRYHPAAAGASHRRPAGQRPVQANPIPCSISWRARVMRWAGAAHLHANLVGSLGGMGWRRPPMPPACGTLSPGAGDAQPPAGGGHASPGQDAVSGKCSRRSMSRPGWRPVPGAGSGSPRAAGIRGGLQACAPPFPPGWSRLRPTVPGCGASAACEDQSLAPLEGVAPGDYVIVHGARPLDPAGSG